MIRIGEVRIAAVNDEVVFFQNRQQFIDDTIYCITCRNENDDRTGLL